MRKITIGEIIDKHLREHNMSQRQFAKLCDLSNGYISMLIKNKNPHSDKPISPSLTAILKISQALNIPFGELIKKADDIQIDIPAEKNFQQVFTTNKVNPKNNALTSITLKLQNDAEFFEAVDKFVNLNEDNKKLVISLIDALAVKDK